MMNLPPSMQKERIRLIKPSRHQAPTEYNLQYKKWPLRPFTHDTFHVIKQSRPTAKKPQKIIQLSSVGSSNSTGYPDSSHSNVSSSDRPSSAASDLRDPPVLSKQWFENFELVTALRAKTAPLHERPAVKKSVTSQGRTKLPIPAEELSEKHHESPETGFSVKLKYVNDALEAHKQPNVKFTLQKPQNLQECRKEAWVASSSSNKVTSPAKAKGDSGNTDVLRMGDLCRAIDQLDQWNIPDGQFESRNCIEDLPSAVNTVKHVNSDSVVSVKPFDSPPKNRSKSAKECNKKLSGEKRRKKPFSIEGIDEASAKKLYADLSAGDLKRLQKTYKGLIGTKRDKSKTPSKTTQEDIESFRQTAMRATNTPYLTRTSKDWSTSYNLDYRNWQDFDDPNIKTVFRAKSSTLDGSKIAAQQSLEERTNSAPESKQSAVSSETKASIDNQNDVPLEGAALKSEGKQLTDAERDRIIQEAEQIEEHDYEATFGPDGKPKMDIHASSGAFKAWNVKKPDVPIWADKTVVSLGSGHWNLPLNKSDEWELKADASEGDENFKPSARAKPAFKLRVTDRLSEESNKSLRSTATCDESKSADGASATADQFLSMYYPDRRTNANYLTEYMRKFHQFPVQHNRVRV